MLRRELLEDATLRIAQQYIDSGKLLQRMFQLHRPNLENHQSIPYVQKGGTLQLARDIGMASSTRADLFALENFTLRYAVTLRFQEAERLDLQNDYRRTEGNPLHGWYAPLLGFGVLGMLGGASVGHPVEGGLVGIAAGLAKDLWDIHQHRSAKQRLTVPQFDALATLEREQRINRLEIIDETLAAQRDEAAYLINPVSIAPPPAVNPAPG